MVQSCFPSLAAWPLSAASRGALAVLAHGHHAWTTSPLKTRVGVSRSRASGRLSRRAHRRSMFTPGSRPCAYRTASGRGKWHNPDPLCNRPIVPLKDVVFRELRYVFPRNDGVGWIDPLGLWEGTFVVSHYNVPLHGGDARTRSIPDGGTVPGFSVKYVPEKKTCSCPKDKIVIVQVISHNSNAVPGKDPQVDSSYSGPLPGAYSGSRNGNLQIFDAPWNNWIFETTYTIEDCALCRNGQHPETILGCVKFTWTKDGHELDPQRAISAGGPSQMWNDGVARWTATHPGGN